MFPGISCYKQLSAPSENKKKAGATFNQIQH